MNPADVILNGSLLAAMPIALLAGLVTFLSPCVLPLVPGYLGYVSGAAQSKTKLVLGAVLFVLGFTVVFVSLGVLAGSAGLLFFANSFWVQFVLGLLVVVFGLAMIGQFGFLQRSFKIPFSPKVGLAGAPLLGVVFAVGWTPCIGPTLAAVLTIASTTGDPVRGGILARAWYALGGVECGICEETPAGIQPLWRRLIDLDRPNADDRPVGPVPDLDAGGAKWLRTYSLG
ncbi:MAG: hypothetical protein RL024_26 [Actinomycetota bacterium]